MTQDFSDPMTHMEQLAVELLRSAIKRDVDGVASCALDIKILSKSMEIDVNAAADLERRRLARQDATDQCMNAGR